MTRIKGLAILVAVLGTLLAACGGGGEAEVAAAIAESVEEAIEATDAAAGGDGDGFGLSTASLPDGLTIPVPDGGSVTLSVASDGMVAAALTYPADQLDSVIAFYDDALADFTRNETFGDDYRGVSYGAAGGKSVIVNTCIDMTADGNFDATCVTINEES